MVREYGSEQANRVQSGVAVVESGWSPKFSWPACHAHKGRGAVWLRGMRRTSGDVVPWVGAASWESRVGVAVVETRNVMVAVVQLPWKSCHVY